MELRVPTHHTDLESRPRLLPHANYIMILYTRNYRRFQLEHSCMLHYTAFSHTMTFCCQIATLQQSIYLYNKEHYTVPFFHLWAFIIGLLSLFIYISHYNKLYVNYLAKKAAAYLRIFAHK